MQRKRKNFRPRFVNRVQKDNNYTNNAYGVLPAPGILESYEEISEGSVSKILEMVKAEQNHRHTLDQMLLQKQAFTIWVGQILGVALAVITLFACMLSVSDESYFVAFVIAMGGFGFLSFCAWSSTRAKPIFSKHSRLNGRK